MPSQAQLKAAQKRAHCGLALAFPGSVSIGGGEAVACAVYRDMATVHGETGGDARVRALTAWISKEVMAAAPGLRAEMVDDLTGEVFEITEVTGEDAENWLVRGMQSPG